jgi:uncharacterized membrane protein
LIVAGFVIGKVDVPGNDDSTVLDIVAAVLIVPTWFFYGRYLIRRARERHDAAAAAAPRELSEPPSRDDPAVVAVVLGRGTPSRRAIAATVLALADANAIEINEYGEKVVIEIPNDARGATATDELVLVALHERADPEGKVVGPPIWDDEKVPWWRDYARDARGRAMSAHLVENRVPLLGLMLVSILTATALALIFFWYVLTFIGLILLANTLPWLAVGVSGYRLTADGVRDRSRWIAFGRYVAAQGSVSDVGPAAVSIWGPNLVYGVLLGEGDRAARVLSPAVGRDEVPHELVHEYSTET